MPGKLRRNMPCSSRLSRQICKRGFALLNATGAIDLTQQSMVARFVPRRKVHKSPRFADTTFPTGKSPPCNDACARRHVVLRIAAVDPERMQLEDFSREIFIE